MTPRWRKGPWTSDELDILRRMNAAGENDTAISHALNRSRHGVATKRRELGIPAPSRWSDADTKLLRRLHAERVPAEQIAQRLGRTPGAVWMRLYVLGLSNGSSVRPYSDQEDRDLKAMRNAGLPADIIARALGRTTASVNHRASLLGLPRPRNMRDD